MTRRPAPVLRVFASAPATADAAAEEIATVLRRRPAAVLILASGKTMVPVYRGLVRRNGDGRAPFSRAATFNLDELAVSAADPRSFRAFMERHLFSRVDLDPRRVHFLRGDARGPEAECARYEDELARLGPAELALVGIGRNGHVAYLEPGRSLAPVTSPVRLSAATRSTLESDGVVPAPRRALTMGIETILSARRVLLVATGKSKATAIACALGGPVAASCPASYLSLHPRLTVLLDRQAAREISSPSSVPRQT
ncbi:MAG: glucosamine-6-phosphate deaminase [Acidobacteria bacterium]|nr:glucosamine-6-phosphate deaminase [Acidobacteriota bacterium]MCA1610517.1 glucosamine-6-phosphate deaminase [Acidobacteriota bacterium]MCA1617483.1 glucosamine-6-phosphate deaminase [Acidobacteriota bacterium]